MVCEIMYTTMVVRNATSIAHRRLCETESLAGMGLRTEARDRLRLVMDQIEITYRFVKSSRVGRSVAVKASMGHMDQLIERSNTMSRLLLRKRRMLD